MLFGFVMGLYVMSQVTTEKIKFSTPVMAQLAVWIVTIMLAYSALNARITTLEVKYDRLTQDISEIKSDVKQLLQRKQP